MTDALLQFETLSREDILLIMEEKWDPEKKGERVKGRKKWHLCSLNPVEFLLAERFDFLSV
ncbi:MAG: hypothetical protein KR126chlam1_00723 [Chlamydiae bacterium]|nr:hypothetical protein [Chlamydiota bacterium]